jgi:hypothetical protein
MKGRARGAGVAFALLGAAALVVLGLGLAARQAPRRGAPPSAPIVSERFPVEWPSLPPAEVAALLDGLGPGAELGGFRVRAVSPVLEGRVVIDVARGDAGFRVAVVRKERDARRPPASTERYALFTQQPRPDADSITEEEYGAVVGALAARVREREGKVPIPAGM